jgi:hypothetical protein
MKNIVIGADTGAGAYYVDVQLEDGSRLWFGTTEQHHLGEVTKPITHLVLASSTPEHQACGGDLQNLFSNVHEVLARHAKLLDERQTALAKASREKEAKKAIKARLHEKDDELVVVPEELIG